MGSEMCIRDSARMGHRPVLNGDGSRRGLIQPSDQIQQRALPAPCLLYTSDAADERSSVDLGGRRIIKKKNTQPL